MTAEEWKTVAPVVSACVALLALGVSLFALAQARKTMRAQTFLAALKVAEDIKLSNWMDFIRGLTVTSYAGFLGTATPAQQEGVRSVIDYFNHLGHLVDYRYLTPRHVRRIYWVSLKDIRDHLLDWWLVGFRAAHGQPYYYRTFERLVKSA
jgi:hypothetical protein